MKIKTTFFLIIMTLSLETQTKSETAKQLPACPDSPNCVSSQAKDDAHFIAPFKIIGKVDEAWIALKTALLKQSRTVITADNGDTLHATVTSLVFRFVDDIDVILDEEAGVINIRSASRTGYSDVGVNRKRLEKLRSHLQQARLID